MPREVTVRILGSGGAVPSKYRWVSGVLVVDWMGNRVLLDAGEGVQMRLQEAGYSTSSIDVVAVTHEHGDHVNGLAGLLQSMYVNDRTRPLKIIAPKPVLEFIDEVLEATETRLGFPIAKIEALGNGSTTLSEAGGYKLGIHWFPTCHSKNSMGYKLTWTLRPKINIEALESIGVKPGPWVRELLEKGAVEVEGKIVRISQVGQPQRSASIVYTGDTAPCMEVIEASRGAEVLIHDSTYSSDMTSEAVSRGHSTARAAAFIAKEAGVGLLVLTHVSSRYRGGEALKLLREARSVFPNTILAWDHARMILRF